MRTAQPDTRNAIEALRARPWSYPQIARHLELEPRHIPTLSRIVKGGPVSVRLENEIRAAVGLQPIRRKRYWRPCLPHNLTADQKRRIMEIAEE